MKLYASLTSPYARKIRIVLREKAISCDLIEADANEVGSPVPALNPLGKVPVLVRDDGSVLFDSPVILEWLDCSKLPALIPGEGEARWQVLRWQALADGIMDATVQRLTETRRKPERQSMTLLAQQDAKVARALTFANERISGEHLVGSGFTLADIALCVALDYVDLRHPHDWRGANPALARWHAAIAGRASFAATRPPGLSGTHM